MLTLQKPIKCLEVLSNPLVISVRTLKRVKPHYPLLPPQFWRRPPGPGEPVKVYPLEPAAEAMKAGPYRLDRWTDWRMKKDWLRRQCVIKLGRERMMLDTIHQNDILPIEIREKALEEVHDTLPRDSNHMRLVRRCAITSRPRATVEPWRASRFIFRHLADYNKLSGVQRGMWG